MALARDRPAAKRLAILVCASVGLLALAGWGAGELGLLRRWQLAAVSHRLGRPVYVDGELTLTPGLHGLTVRFTRLHVDQPAWAGPGHLLWIDRGLVRLPWSVLVGDSRLDDVELDGLQLALRRSASGRSNWSGPRGAAPSAPAGLGRLVVRHGGLDLQDAQRGLSFHGGVDATLDKGVSTLLTRGGGQFQGRPWSLQLVSSQSRPGSSRYALSAQVALDAAPRNSSLRFDGELRLTRRPELAGRISGEGTDLHAFSQLSGLPLPRTPPYRLAAQIDATRAEVKLQQMSGRIGASDVAGVLTVTPQPDGRRLDADLSSRSLRISDLFAVASGGQLTASHRSPDQLLPDAPIQAEPLRKLSGVVRFSAAHVQPPTTPTIRSLQLTVRFDRGRVSADPLALELERGRGLVRMSLDVRGPVPQLSLTAELAHADTGEVFKAAGAPIQASFNARAHLQGAGASLAAAAADASGPIDLEALDGRLQEAPADVLSANFVRAVISLLTRNPSPVGLKCAVARFQMTKGQARATTLRLSTALGGVEGQGGFSLANDTLDMTLRPTGALSGPTFVRIVGPLAHPKPTLALDSPGRVLGRALRSLTGRRIPPPANEPGCG